MKARLIRTGYGFFVGCTMSVLSRYPLGTNVYEKEWDVLLLLDTCRVDALRKLVPEYGFLGPVDSMWSVGSTSSEWIAQTFTKRYLEEIRNTSYISANAWSEWVIERRRMPEDDKNAPISWTAWNVIEPNEFRLLDHVWKYADPPKVGMDHVPPQPDFVTDRVIQHARDQSIGRMIVHYSQPHAPYTSSAMAEGRELYKYEKHPFRYLQNGGDKERVWKAYLDNLRYVLDSVEILLRNLDADTVAISADHGEGFGEWGIYGHPAGIPHPFIKRVPWATVSAEDLGERLPADHRDVVSTDAEQQLEALGYLG